MHSKVKDLLITVLPAENKAGTLLARAQVAVST